MRAITMYEAEDGDLFRTKDECRARDEECAAVRGIMAPLKRSPDLQDSPVTQYFQHDPRTVTAVRVTLVGYLRSGPLASWWKDPKWAAAPLEDFHPDGALGRVCSGSGRSPACRAFGRFSRIDGHGREWSQNYFANNTPTAREEVR